MNVKTLHSETQTFNSSNKEKNIFVLNWSFKAASSDSSQLFNRWIFLNDRKLGIQFHSSFNNL